VVEIALTLQATQRLPDTWQYRQTISGTMCSGKRKHRVILY